VVGTSFASQRHSAGVGSDRCATDSAEVEPLSQRRVAEKPGAGFVRLGHSAPRKWICSGLNRLQKGNNNDSGSRGLGVPCRGSTT
jgi:hypothetical protein